MLTISEIGLNQLHSSTHKLIVSGDWTLTLIELNGILGKIFYTVITPKEQSMKQLIKSIQLIIFATSLVLFVAVTRHGNVVAAESSSQENIQTLQMSVERAAHQATLLKNGKVLVSGGCARRGCKIIHRSAELFDSYKKNFSSAGSMVESRVSHASTLLKDGRVLILGGWTGQNATKSAEIYDSNSNSFVATDSMAVARIGPVATPLQDGRVLVTGGEPGPGLGLNTSEVFDPKTMNFSLSGQMSANRGAHVAVALADGRVLITGGHQARGEILQSAEIYDPNTGEFSPTGDMTIPRHKHAGLLLPDGRVLIVGGSDARDFGGRYASTEFYDPDTGKFSPGPQMHWPRFKIRHSLVLLQSGAVLVAGGAVRNELLQPDSLSFAETGKQLSGPQMFTSALQLPSGKVLVTGGYDERLQPSEFAWLIAEFSGTDKTSERLIHASHNIANQ